MRTKLTPSPVCGVVTAWNPADDPEKKHVQVENVIPVAGNFDSSTGASLAPKVERLKAQDSSLEGLQIEFNGGNYNKMNQRAVIQLQCDKDRTGNEDVEEEEEEKRKRDEGEDEEDPPKSSSSLSFVSYGQVEGKNNMEVLRLNWRTKYACEDYANSDEARRSGWGFFTWFLLMYEFPLFPPTPIPFFLGGRRALTDTLILSSAFLGIAAYLIFGSWLNYNRYGARGWDLLPHGDTIRDIPYLIKDLSRKVVDTVSGGGSRGGYSAV